ncbi:MAG TPA: hypothetical protein VHX44_19945, partial [Planctomycetota bacterium]|nr:hypothetical protein [Planctomycetota bacterium]
FSISGSYGGFGVAAAHDGWWGPAGYRSVIVHHQLRSDGRDAGVGAPRRTEARELPPPALSDNLYRRPGNQDKVNPATVSRSSVRPAEPRRPGAPPTPNDRERVVPGRDGEVYRRHGEGWEQWQHNGWQPLPRGDGHANPPAPVTPPERAPTPPPSTPPPPPGKNPEHAVPPPRLDAPTKPPPAHEPPTPPVGPVPETRPAAPRPDGAGKPPAAPDQRPPQPRPPQSDPHREEPRREEPRRDEPHLPSAPPALRAEQLEREQHLQERGDQRAEQFQRYRAHPPEDERHGSGDGPRPHGQP